MPKASQMLAALAATLALGALAGAEAQKPTPPTPPKTPVKPISTIKPPSAPLTGGVTIICRDFSFGTMPGALPYRDSRITYETVTVKDTSGAPRTIYAPTHIVISHEFKPAKAGLGPNGRGLVAGECGTLNAVISDTTGPATLQFDNFPSVFVQLSKKTAGDTPMHAVVNLPPCPSGLRSFRTMRQSANEFLVADSASVACLN